MTINNEGGVEKTEWYPAHMRPVRIGEYEVNRPCMHGTPHGECRMYWNGQSWRYLDHTYSDFGSV